MSSRRASTAAASQQPSLAVGGAGEASSIQVVVRVRDLNEKEAGEEGGRHAGTMSAKEKSIEIVDPSANGSRNKFDFSKVLWSMKQSPTSPESPPYASQESVYNHIGPKLLDHAFSGRNVCVFAYGQTGSGKTYSMIGEDDNSNHHQREDLRGLIPRICEELFARTRDASATTTNRAPSMAAPSSSENNDSTTPAFNENATSSTNSNTTSIGKFKVSSTFIEIYNDQVHDLLQKPSPYITCKQGEQQPLQVLSIRQHPTEGFFVEGVESMPVNTTEDVMKLLHQGMDRRATAETRMNQRSSRSHAIFQLHLSCEYLEEAEDGTVLTHKRTSKISLVDLAGSENVKQSGASGERFKEASNINNSLTVLGRIIRELAEADPTKPRPKPAYRESALTELLSDSIGGNSITVMIATVSPSKACYTTSLNTLRFAGQAQKIVNVVHVNEARETAKVLADLKKQVAQLTLELECAKNGGGSGVNSDGVSYKKQVETLTSQVHQYQTRCRLLEIKLQDQGGDIKTQLRSSDNNVAQLTVENAQLKAELQTLRRTTKKHLSDKDSELLHLQGQCQAKDREITELRSKLQYDQETGGFTADKAAKAEVKMAALRTQSDALVAKNKQMCEEMAAIQAHLRESEEQRIQLEDALMAAQHKSEMLAKKVQVTEQNDTNFKNTVADLRVKLCDAEASESSMKARVELLEKQLEAATVKAASTAEASAKSKKTSGAQLAAAAVAEEQNKQLRESLEATQASLKSLRHANVQYTMETRDLKEKLSRATNKLKDARADSAACETLLMEEAEASSRAMLHCSYYRGFIRLMSQRVVEIREACMKDKESALQEVSGNTPYAQVLEEEALERLAQADSVYTEGLNMAMLFVSESQLDARRAKESEEAAKAELETAREYANQMENGRRAAEARMIEENAQLSTALEEREMTITKMEDDLAKSKASLSERQTRLSDAHTKLVDLESQHATERLNLLEALKKAEGTVRDLQHELQRSENKFADTNDDINRRYESTIRQMQSQHQLDMDLEAARRKKLEGQVTELRSTLKNIESMESDAEGRESEMKSRISLLERDAKVRAEEVELMRLQGERELQALSEALETERQAREEVEQRLEEEQQQRASSEASNATTTATDENNASGSPHKKAPNVNMSSKAIMTSPPPLRHADPNTPMSVFKRYPPPLNTSMNGGSGSYNQRGSSGVVPAHTPLSTPPGLNFASPPSANTMQHNVVAGGGTHHGPFDSPSAHDVLLAQITSSANRLAEVNRVRHEMEMQRERIRALDENVQNFSDNRSLSIMHAHQKIEEVARGLNLAVGDD